MPGFLTDKCIEIRNWFAIGSDVYPDSVVTGWIRMAEEYLSTALRVKHMIQIDTATFVGNRAPLPLDWQEIRLVRWLDTGGVGRYLTPDAFYNPEFPDPPDASLTHRNRRYTILGNYLIVEDPVDPGLQVELTYYQDIPPLTDDANNWANKYNQTVYTLKILHIASLYAIEDERSGVWNSELNIMINGMNARHQIDKASGSVLTQVRRKTFG
jgi:hypothetical protein